MHMMKMKQIYYVKPELGAQRFNLLPELNLISEFEIVVLGLKILTNIYKVLLGLRMSQETLVCVINWY